MIIAAEVRDADVAKLWWLTFTWLGKLYGQDSGAMTHGRVTTPQMGDKGFADVGDDSWGQRSVMSWDSHNHPTHAY